MCIRDRPYPCCRSTHCTIDGTLSLRRQGLRAEDVESIEVRTYLVGNKQCGMSDGSRNPKKPVDAKFSTPFTVAAALLYGEVTLSLIHIFCHTKFRCNHPGEYGGL